MRISDRLYYALLALGMLVFFGALAIVESDPFVLGIGTYLAIFVAIVYNEERKQAAWRTEH